MTARSRPQVYAAKGFRLMPNFLARSTVGVLLALQAFSPALVFAQDASQKQSRTSDQDRRSPETPQKPAGEWQIGESLTIFDQPASDSPAKGSPYKQEPIIRVALATDVRVATVSTAGHLMNASDEGPTLVAMDVTRVRLEPRLLSPLPAADYTDTFRVQLAGFSTREEAEQKSKEAQEASTEDSQIVYDTETKTWGLLVGPRRPQLEAEELRARLESAGMDATVVPAASGNAATRQATTGAQTIPASASSQFPVVARSGPSQQSSSIRTVRPAARFSLPTREVVASAPGAGRLFSSSAPVVFASDSATTPVRFDDRPYRGRIEVFTNTRGALTVVNVLGLEDYVKGVVPNELSAGGYPLLEAHKAQAIAARTYALRNRGQFMSQGYDLLPTTRSQVYRGLVSENSLSSRAVDETRGIIATYNGEPINALYTSTCGGRTEDAGNIFNDAVPYLRGRECAAEGRAALASFTIKTNREPPEFKEENLPLARDVALLSVQGFTSLKKVSDSWLKDDAELEEVRSWLTSITRLTHQPAFAVTEDVIRPPAFATALSNAVFGESRGGTLLDNADVEYFLAVRDANEIPAANRADVAMMIRDGYLAVLPDATLHPREPLSRARALHTIARILEARNLLQLQKGTARPTSEDTLVLRSTKGKDQPLKVGEDAFLFRQIGEGVYPVRSVALVGGEPVIFHVNAGGEVDFLEVRPAPNGASADRFSPFTNWTAELSLGQTQGRLGRFANGIGSLVDLRVIARVMYSADAFAQRSDSVNNSSSSSGSMTTRDVSLDSLSLGAAGDTASACARSAPTAWRSKASLTTKFSRRTIQELN
jgi:stage II sporulation protein D